MTFLSKILKPHFTSSRGLQGIQGTSNSTQGIQGIQGIQGVGGLSNGTLITNTQPGSYTLQSSDVGKVVSGVSTVGIPSDVFNPGENIVILNNDSDKTILDIGSTNPAISIYEAGVGVALTENKYIAKKSFISIFCTRVNEFIINGKIFEPLKATGGTIIDSDGYRIHVFTGTGPFNVTYVGPNSNTVEYVVVAGGGGGNSLGGGGGAGGFRTGTNFPVTIQDYTITVGSGGRAAPSVIAGNSVFSTITSSGGGAGGGGNGGSGGGGNYSSPTLGGLGNRLTGTTTPSPTQGNDGGNGIAVSPSSPSSAGGGGGGAGASGSPSPGAVGGDGGNGTLVTWVPASYGTPGPSPGRWFAGGGGGGTGSPGITGGSGGSGGGGSGGSFPGVLATSGTTNTGGGGGGGGGFLIGSGGSGIVIIRYPIT